MHTEQRKAALESMVAWLAHPHELGKTPATIEHAGEFERHGMRYYMFKYKKSRMSFDWLLGVCGGYQGDSLEHCGHVFSEMETYDPAVAEEKAAAMVEMIRGYWMKEAERVQAGGEDEDSDGGSFVAFVLLASKAWDAGRFRKDMEADWDILVPEDADGHDGEGGEDGHDSEDGRDCRIPRLAWEEGGMVASVSLVPVPVPDEEAEHNAATNSLWPEAAAVAKTHAAHLLVAVLPSGGAYAEAGRLMVKVIAACLKQKTAIGVYASGTVFEPEWYRKAAGVVHSGEIPVRNLVNFGVFRTEKGFSAYTCGMKSFGKDEMEILDSAADPDELRDFLCAVAARLIAENTSLHHGDTVEANGNGRFPVTLSGGICLDGQTLKIGYKPA